jgi:hypothetical protein
MVVLQQIPANSRNNDHHNSRMSLLRFSSPARIGRGSPACRSVSIVPALLFCGVGFVVGGNGVGRKIEGRLEIEGLRRVMITSRLFLRPVSHLLHLLRGLAQNILPVRNRPADRRAAHRAVCAAPACRSAAACWLSLPLASCCSIDCRSAWSLFSSSWRGLYLASTAAEAFLSSSESDMAFWAFTIATFTCADAVAANGAIARQSNPARIARERSMIFRTPLMIGNPQITTGRRTACRVGVLPAILF